jgi:hypothetical protein
MRIASTMPKLRITVYALLFVTWASFFITFIGTLTYCEPVEAIWNPMLVMTGKATCAPVETFIIIGHCATVSTIATDLALVVVPAIILWNTQMKRQAKLQAFGLLSFASIASIITIVRIPYVNKFGGLTDLSCTYTSTPSRWRVFANVQSSLGSTYYALLEYRNRDRVYMLIRTLAQTFAPTRRQRKRLEGS